MVEKGHNADRHLCKKCKYRSDKFVNGCDYIVHNRHSRGCKVEDCDKFVKGRKLRVNKRNTSIKKKVIRNGC